MKTIIKAALLAILGCSPAAAQWGGTSADTVRINPAFDNLRFGNVFIDTTGKIAVGPGANTNMGNVQAVFKGPIASDGNGTTAVGTVISPQVTGAAGDISYQNMALIGPNWGGSITTGGNTEVIGVISSLYLSEPVITLGTGDSATNAATLYIHNAPTEGNTYNSALHIASGDVTLLNGDMLLRNSGGAQYPVLDIINPSTSANARPMIRVGQDTTAALELYRIGNAAATYINANQAGASINFKTVGTTALTIDSDQEIGIGTATPDRHLVIESGVADIAARFESSDPGAYLNFQDNTSGNNVLVGAAGDDLLFQLGGTQKFTFESDGRLGMGGVADAGVALEINHPSARAVAKSFITAEDATDGTEIFSVVTDASGNPNLNLRNAAGAQAIQFDTDGTDSWINSGDFGIGLTNPTSLLMMEDGTEAEHRLWASSDAALGSAGSAWTTYGIKDSGAGTTPDYSWSVGMDGGHTQASLFFGYSASAWDAPGNNPLMTITPSGDVGIGDATPNAKLDVYNSVDENIAAIFEVAGTNARLHLKDGNTTAASTVGIGANGDTLHFLADGYIAGRATYTGGVGSLEATGWGEFGFGISHMDDVDTYFSFTPDAAEMWVGGTRLLRLAEVGGTDSVRIGLQDDVVAIKDSHMVFLPNDNDVVMNGVEVTGDIDALTESGQVLAITGTYPVLYFNDVTTAAGGDNDFTIQVNNDFMSVVDETGGGQAMLHMDAGSVVIHKGSGTIDHHLEVQNGATYSELDAGEASFTTSSTPAMKRNIQPLAQSQIEALRQAFLDSVTVYNYQWRQDALFSAADSAAILANTSNADGLLEKEVAKLERRRAVRQVRLDSVIQVDRAMVKIDTTGFDTLALDTSYAVTLDSLGQDTVAVDTSVRAEVQAVLDTVYADVPRLVRVDTSYTEIPGQVTEIERQVLRQDVKQKLDARISKELTRASQDAATRAAEQRVGFMAPEAKIISRIVAPGAERDDELNSHHLMMAQVALIQDLLVRVQQLEERVEVLEGR